MFISFIKIEEIDAGTFTIGVLIVLIHVFQCNFWSDPEDSCGLPAEFIIVDTDEEEFAAVCKCEK